MNNIKEKLIELVSSYSQLPYMFVGTGFAMRYSNALSWNELLRNIWNILYPERTDNEYKKYLRKIITNLKMDNSKLSEEELKYYINPQIATEIQ